MERLVFEREELGNDQPSTGNFEADCRVQPTGTALSRPPRDFSDTRGKDGRAEGFNLSFKCANKY